MGSSFWELLLSSCLIREIYKGKLDLEFSAMHKLTGSTRTPSANEPRTESLSLGSGAAGLPNDCSISSLFDRFGLIALTLEAALAQ